MWPRHGQIKRTFDRDHATFVESQLTGGPNRDTLQKLSGATMQSDLKELTLQALRNGISDSDEQRRWIAKKTGRVIDFRFTNAHAWALVHLQRDGLIRKIAPKIYELKPRLGAPSH